MPKIMLKDLLKNLLTIFRKVNWPPDPTKFPTLFLLNLWNQELPEYNHEKSIELRQMIIDKGYDDNQIIIPFNNIIETDDHLYKCCYDKYRLAVLIDKYFINEYWPYLSDDDNFDFIYDKFYELVYKTGAFNKIAFSHIFNFDSSQEEIIFDNFKIEKVDDTFIPYVTGEDPCLQMSFLHPKGMGNHFLTIQDNIVISDKDIQNWLSNCHKFSEQITGILQYVKDGLIHIDYTNLLFSPEWVNFVRRPGLSCMIGRPRTFRLQNIENYFLDAVDIQKFRQILPIFSKYKSKIYGDQSELRQYIERAGFYYELSLKTERLDSRFLDLWISMETLFSPSDKEQLSHSIAENSSFLLEEDSKKREQIFRTLKRNLYRKRSGLVHGGKSKQLNLDDVNLLSSYVRRSLVKFTVLQLRGFKNRKQVHDFIEEAIFNPEKAKKLSLATNLSSFIFEKEGVSIELGC